MAPEKELPLSEAEMKVVRSIAKRDGVTVDEAATKLAQAGLARRVRKKTGRGQAKVYSMRKS